MFLFFGVKSYLYRFFFSFHIKRYKHDLYQPVYRSNDEGDCGEAYGCRGPLAHRQRPLGASAEQVERRRAHAVNGEAGDDHRGQGLPHKRVHDCNCYPCCPPWVVPMCLEEQMKDQKTKQRKNIFRTFN